MKAAFPMFPWLVAALLSLPAGSSAARPEEGGTSSDGAEPSATATADAGYRGVLPGRGNNLPRIAEIKSQKGTWVTWPGFMVLEGGASRVFLQTTGAVRYEQKIEKDGLEVVVRLKQAKVFLPNNKNPLVTAHFTTPLSRAYLRPKGKDLELHLEMKIKALPSVSESQDGDGYHYLFFDLPPLAQ